MVYNYQKYNFKNFTDKQSRKMLSNIEDIKAVSQAISNRTGNNYFAVAGLGVDGSGMPLDEEGADTNEEMIINLKNVD